MMTHTTMMIGAQALTADVHAAHFAVDRYFLEASFSSTVLSYSQAV